jgi:hypothetical protein
MQDAVVRIARIATALVLMAAFGFTTGARAQRHGDAHVEFAGETWDARLFEPDGTWDTTIPTPESVLGFPIGRRPARYEEVRRYLEALDAASDRIVVRTHGRTHEDRELVHAVIGTPERIAQLDAVRESMRRWADPRQGGGDAVPADLPVVAWLGYSIHGDELSGCDAAVQAAYQLVAGTDARTRGILESVVVCIDPMQNPDGRERYLAQMQAANGRIPNPDDQSLQHRGFWPWGRANHYLFDLNRDWFTTVHPESRGRVTAISGWNPQLVVDGHEMGWNSTYLFSPPREPFNPHLPVTIRKWWETFAHDQAATFDRAGWSFYTREWNEEFFPGYGSSWAMYFGAVGILYEQGGTDGSVVRQTDGTYLTFREAVQHQYASTIANLDTAARNREALLRDYRAGRRAAVEAGRSGPVRAYVLVPGADPGAGARLAAALLRQGVEVQRATSALELRDATDFWGRSGSRRTVPAGSWVVSLAQPAAPLVRNLLDVHVAMPDSFLREERAYLENQKESRLYDVTTWSLPLAYGVEAYWTSQDVGRDLQPVDLQALETERAPEARGGTPSYGWVIDGAGVAAMQAIAHLLDEGLVLRVALDDFRVGGMAFRRGSALLRVNANPATLSDVLARVGAATGATIVPISSGRADAGPDLGGDRFPEIVPHRIALLTGMPVSFVSYGSLWHLLDHDIGTRVSSLDVQSFGDYDLAKYNVLVMPHVFGGADSYARALGEGGVKKLKQWVQSGGTLVAIGAGAAFAADSSQALSAVRLRQDVLVEHPPRLARLDLPEAQRMEGLGDKPAPPLTDAMPLLGGAARRFVERTRPRGVRLPLAAPLVIESPKDSRNLEHLRRADARLRRFYPQGAFVRADVDAEHWLTAGVVSPLPVMVASDRALIARSPVHVVVRYAAYDSLALSGLLWPEAADRLARTACVTRESLGSGQIILFAEDPTYRRHTPALERLILNAAVLGPGLGTSRAAPW